MRYERIGIEATNLARERVVVSEEFVVWGSTEGWEERVWVRG